MTAPVGFIGLGNIGAPMARHLLDWPGGLVVCDLREEVTGPFAAEGATVACTAAEAAAAGATVISVMVRDDDQVRAVVDELLPVAAPGTVILIHSTITPATAEELAARAAEAGVAVADAPVSGGFMGATDGRLAVMVGASDEAFERCRPVCERFGELVLHLGPPGAGTRAKLARNLLTFASYAVAAEAQRLAEAAGVSLSKLARVVRHSDQLTGGPGAIMVRRETGPLAPDDPLFEIFSHSRDLGEKDLRLALALGEELGVDLPFATLALRTLADGLGVPHQP